MKKDLLLLVASVALAHDLFLKLDTYFLEPRTRVRVTVLNGTFAKRGIRGAGPGGGHQRGRPGWADTAPAGDGLEPRAGQHEPAQSSTRCPRHVRGRRLDQDTRDRARSRGFQRLPRGGRARRRTGSTAA